MTCQNLSIRLSRTKLNLLLVLLRKLKLVFYFDLRLQETHKCVLYIGWINGEIVRQAWCLLRPYLVTLNSIVQVVVEHSIDWLAFDDEGTLFRYFVFESSAVAFDPFFVIADYSFNVWIDYDILCSRSFFSSPCLTFFELLRHSMNRSVWHCAQFC